MLSNFQLSIILLIAALIWGILIVLNNFAAFVWLNNLITVSGIVMIIVSAFDLLFWRWPFLQGWFVNRPDLNGTWQTVIKSNWIDPSTGKKVEPIESYIAIRQTYLSLSLRLMTKESASELIGGKIIRASDGVYRVVGVYRNEPKLSVQDRSRMHYGAILLQVFGTPPEALSGHYWTDRDSAGELELTKRHRKVFDNFEAAKQAFNQLSKWLPPSFPI